MSTPTSGYLPLLQTYLDELALAARLGPVLDLACGSGRNGLYLLENRIPVVFADIRADALASIQLRLDEMLPDRDEPLSSVWEVDFELPGSNPFAQRMFGGMVVFSYLYRPLLGTLKQSVHPGGLVIYQTFTLAQIQFGRPKNPDFLLQPGELREHFSDWDVLHYYEGVVKTGSGSKAIAQLVASKPAAH